MSDITKKVIAGSFISLLEQTPFDKITIGDITEKAGINRQTFYYHFQDIKDLIEWTISTGTQEIIKDKRDYANWQEGYLRIFKYIEKNKTFYRCLTLNDGYNQYTLNSLYEIVIN